MFIGGSETAPSVVRSKTATFYDSGQQTLTQAGQVSLTHGLGGKPDGMTLVLVCLTPEYGYVAGDEVVVPAAMYIDALTRYYGCSIIVTGTTFDVQLGNKAGVFWVHRRDAGNLGNVSTVTAASWAWVIRAFRLKRT